MIHEQKMHSSQVEKAVRRMAFECKFWFNLIFRYAEAYRKALRASNEASAAFEDEHICEPAANEWSGGVLLAHS